MLSVSNVSGALAAVETTEATGPVTFGLKSLPSAVAPTCQVLCFSPAGGILRALPLLGRMATSREVTINDGEAPVDVLLDLVAVSRLPGGVDDPQTPVGAIFSALGGIEEPEAGAARARPGP